MTQRVGVVGGGIMGTGIAEVAARAGCTVLVNEVDALACEGAQRRITASLAKAVRAGKLTGQQHGEAVGRLDFTAELPDLASCDLVVEAVVEEEHEKTSVFRKLGTIVSPDCLLASNTSSIPIRKLAAVTAHPERVIGMHFFNPVPVLPLVEPVPSLLTSPGTVDRAEAFAGGSLGKHTVLCKDRAGFMVNAPLIPYLLAAVRMVESGFASAEDVDTAMVAGCAHPMGPLALADLIGLDTTAAVAASMYAEFTEPLYAPPPLLLSARTGPAGHGRPLRRDPDAGAPRDPGRPGGGVHREAARRPSAVDRTRRCRPMPPASGRHFSRSPRHASSTGSRSGA